MENPEAQEFFECVQEVEGAKPYHIMKALAKKRMLQSQNIERKLTRLKSQNSELQRK